MLQLTKKFDHHAKNRRNVTQKKVAQTAQLMLENCSTHRKKLPGKLQKLGFSLEKHSKILLFKISI